MQVDSLQLLILRDKLQMRLWGMPHHCKRAGLGLRLRLGREEFISIPSCYTTASRRQERKQKFSITHLNVEEALKSWILKAQKSSSEQKESKQYFFAQTLDFKFPDEFSVNWNSLFLSFFIPMQRIPKAGREGSKVCTHWHFAVRLHTQNMHEKRHLEVILTKHWNPFLKEPKKTLFWNAFPGQNPILLASAWKNAKSLKAVHAARLCTAGTYKSTLKLCT